jgi:ribonucleoside-diphosphate reductase alpha chain
MVIVGLLGQDPYEVFAFKPNDMQLPAKIKAGTLTKIKKGRYDLKCDGITIENIREHFETDEQEALTRIISTALRHGTDIEFIVDQLAKSEGTITSFSKAIGRSLKKYITEQKLEKTCDQCNSKNVALQEGCYTCMDCGSSKCS